MNFTRREAIVAGAAVLLTNPLAAIEPIVRKTAKPHIRLSLAAYTFRKKLDLKKPEWTFIDFIEYAASQGLDAVELTGYYFKSTDASYLAELKLHSARLGLDISGTAIGNDFCVGTPEQLATQIKTAKQWIEHTAMLGGKTIRFFAGKPAKNLDPTQAIQQAIKALQECAEHAKKFGVFVALENHGGITAEADDMLKIVQGVQSDAFGVNLDTGNFRTADPYGDLAKLAPYAVNVQVKTDIFTKGKAKEEANLGKFVEILNKVNYRGYVALEYEGTEDPLVAVPKYLGELRSLLEKK